MPNVTISELPDAILPLDGPNSFLEVQTIESGVDVSRKVASDNISVSVALPIGIAGQLIYNDGTDGVTYLATSAFIYDSGNDVPSMLNATDLVQFRLQDNTGVPAAILRRTQSSAPSDLILRFSHGSFVEVTLAEIGFTASDDFLIGTAPNLGAITLGNANDDVELQHATAPVARTLAAAAGGLEANNTLTGAGFERVLTASDAGGGLPAGSLGDMVYISTAPSTYSAQSVLQVTPSTNTVNITSTSVASQLSMVQAAGGQNFEITTSDLLAFGSTQVNLGFSGGFTFLNANQGGSLTLTGTASFTLVSSATNNFIFRETGSNNELLVDFVTPDWMIRSQDFDGGLQLWGRNTGGSFVQFIDMDPNADVDIYHPLSGVVVARTLTPAAGGLSANNTLTGAGLERVLTLSDLGGGGSPIANLVITDNASIDLVDTNVALNVGAVDPDTTPHLEIGFGVFGPGIQAKATDTTIDALEINRLGGDVSIGSLNTSVAGAVRLNHSSGAAASAVIETTTSGFILEGITGANTILDWHTPGGNLVVRNVFNGSNMQWDGFQNSLEFQFQSRNSGGTIRQLLHMDPDTDIEIYHPPSAAIAIETHTPATGGAFVNNTLTGPGLERVLTESDLTSGLTVGSVMGAVRSNALVRNSTTLVDDPVLSGFPLEPSATYVVECVLQFDGNGNAAAGFQWNWDFNGELADVETLSGRADSHQNDNSTATVRAYQFAQLGNKNPFTNLTIDEAVFMSFGLITQSDYISGTNMDLQWACGTGVTDCRLQEGSYVKITRLA